MMNEISPSKARIKSKMKILRDSFQSLNDSMRVMLAAMPDSERDVLIQHWLVTTETFEEMFAKYSE